MLNEELAGEEVVHLWEAKKELAKLKDENDRLKKIIEKFKKYDKERSEYYKFLTKELRNSGFAHTVEGLWIQINHLKDNVAGLQRRLDGYKLSDKYSPEEIENIIANVDEIHLKEKVDKLKKENENMHAAISEYATKITSLKEKLKQYGDNN